VIWGGGEDGKLTRRLVYGGVTRAGKRDGDGAVRGRGGRFWVWGAPGRQCDPQRGGARARRRMVKASTGDVVVGAEEDGVGRHPNSFKRQP
jgi:hypothetical protein